MIHIKKHQKLECTYGTEIDQKEKLLVEKPAGWITVPVVFFLQQTMQTATIMTHKNMRLMIPPTTAPMIDPIGL